MQLQAKRPPGRADRKVGAYASEILRMRAEGYTYAAILEALEVVGITTTEATLRREVRRPTTSLHRKAADGSFRRELDLSTLPLSTPHSATDDPSPPMTTCARGREVAEAFFNAHPSNPLFRSKEIP